MQCVKCRTAGRSRALGGIAQRCPHREDRARSAALHTECHSTLQQLEGVAFNPLRLPSGERPVFRIPDMLIAGIRVLEKEKKKANTSFPTT